MRAAHGHGGDGNQGRPLAREEENMALRILNPRLEGAEGFQPAPRIPTLDGKVLGVLYNGRAGGDVVLEELLGLLKSKYNLAKVVFRTKPHAWVSAPAEMFKELWQSCEVAITGVGD